MRARARIPARAFLPIILPRASPDSSVPSVASQDDKPIPKLLKAMLDFDPETRASAAEALAMLPGVDKMGVTLPTTGKVYLPPPPESSAEPLATEAGNAGGRPSKRAKGANGGAKSTDVLSASRICKLMEATNPQTAQDAEFLWKRSEPAQKEGVAGAAACALIAFKISETEMWKVCLIICSQNANKDGREACRTPNTN